MQVNVHQAKTQLSKLLQLAEDGEEVIIARNGKPSVRLAPVRETEKKPNLRLGSYSGQIVIPENFEWTEEELDEMLNDDDHLFDPPKDDESPSR